MHKRLCCLFRSTVPARLVAGYRLDGFGHADGTLLLGRPLPWSRFRKQDGPNSQYLLSYWTPEARRMDHSDDQWRMSR